MFPVRYELNFYVNLLRNSVFKGLIRTHIDLYQISMNQGGCRLSILFKLREFHVFTLYHRSGTID
jgi:hypothetical protein